MAEKFLKTGLALSAFKERQRQMFVSNILEKEGITEFSIGDDSVFYMNNAIISRAEVDNIISLRTKEIKADFIKNLALHNKSDRVIQDDELQS